MSLKLITAWPSSDEDDDFEVKSESGSELGAVDDEPDVEYLQWLKTSANEDVKVKSGPGRQPQSIIDTLSQFL